MKEIVMCNRNFIAKRQIGSLRVKSTLKFNIPSEIIGLTLPFLG